MGILTNMGLQLYWHPLSPPARAAYFALKVAGLDFEAHVVNLPAGEHKQPAYLKINPAGLVPCLVDGDLQLAESRAILMYIAEKANNDQLYPISNAARRAKIEEALYWEMGTLTGAFVPIIRPIVWKNAGLNKALVPHAQAQIDKVDAILKANGGTIVAGGFSLADISVEAALSFLKTLFLVKMDPLDVFTYGENIKKWHAEVIQKQACWDEIFGSGMAKVAEQMMAAHAN